MLFLSILVFFLFAVVFHEAGHYLALRKLGVEIEEVGLGIPIPRVPSVKLKIRRGTRSFRLSIHPLILGAYVRMTERGCCQLEALPWRLQIAVHGAGIIANLMLSLTLLLAMTWSRGGPLSLGFWGCALLVPGLALCPVFFSAVLIPALGLLGLVVTGWTLWQTPLTALGGPVALVQISSQHSDTLEHALALGVGLSLMLALVNCLPFSPLDGGKIMVLWLERLRLPRVARAISQSTFYLLLLMIGWGLLCDVIRLLR